MSDPIDYAQYSSPVSDLFPSPEGDLSQFEITQEQWYAVMGTQPW